MSTPVKPFDPAAPTVRIGQDGQFVPPTLRGRFAFGEETFAGRYDNEKDAP
jgi:hypothetical protein